MKSNMSSKFRRLGCFFMIFTLLLGYSSNTNIIVSEAAEKTLSIGQAKVLALNNSTACMLTQSKISLKEVSYKQAVKALQLKRKNKTTFRWSPALDFKFPEALNMSEESEFIYKPMQLQAEITELKHKLLDLKFEVYEEVSNLFVSVFSYQEVIAFQEEQMASLEKSLNKNQARYVLGLANQKDITAIENSIFSLKNSLAENKRKYETEKKKLGELLNLDITTQYRFLRPYVEAEIPRSQLSNLVEHTLANDQSYYEAKTTSQLALLLLNTNYDIMDKEYGSNMKYISHYVQQVKRGEKVDSNAFKLSYDQFLTEIDKPWTGTKKILFIKFPKEWFKGELDGVRYIEDEPYTLYENALEYQDALAEQKQLERDLTQQVEASFEEQVTARNSYNALVQQIEKDKKNLNALSVMNILGNCSFEEYSEAQEQYEELLMESLDALGLYSTLLYSYDRLTCGAVSMYLSDKSISVGALDGAASYIVEEEDGAKNAYYYIQRLIEDNMFELGIYIPDEFETDITHYEFWCDGIQIGSRTERTKSIRHLVLSKNEIEKAVVRFFDGDKYVSECEIDPQSYQGPLEIPGEYIVTKIQNKTQVGSFTVTRNPETSLVSVKMDFLASENICYYTIKNGDGKFVLSANPMEITRTFEYLSLLVGDLGGLTIQCYDKEKSIKYEAYFDTEKYKLFLVE